MRTLKLGHHFTQGTVDSNEVWLDVTATSGGRVIGRSGGCRRRRRGRSRGRTSSTCTCSTARQPHRPPQPAGHLHAALQPPDSAGRRRGRALRARRPAGLTTPVEVEVKLQYRKFDATFMRFALGKTVRGRIYRSRRSPPTASRSRSRAPRCNGRAATARRFRSGSAGTTTASRCCSRHGGSEKGELRQAEAAFAEVERLGRPDGPLNLARVFYKEGRLDEAAAALRRAAASAGAPPWTVGWLNGLVNKQNGHLDEAIANFERVLDAASPEMRSADSISAGTTRSSTSSVRRCSSAPRSNGTARADARRRCSAGGRSVRAHACRGHREYRRALRAGPDHGLLGNGEPRGESCGAPRTIQARRERTRSGGGAGARGNAAANHAAQSIVIYRLDRGAAGRRLAGDRRPRASRRRSHRSRRAGSARRPHDRDRGGRVPVRSSPRGGRPPRSRGPMATAAARPRGQPYGAISA